MKRESSKECSVSFLWANESFSLWSCGFEKFNLVFFTADRSARLVLNQPRKQGFWRNLRYILNTLLYLQRFYKTFSTFLHRRERKPQNVHSKFKNRPFARWRHFTTTTRVVKGATTGSTNQKAGYRSRGTNGPISVQQKVMWPVNHN